MNCAEKKSDSDFEYTFKCGACAYKFTAGMVRSMEGKCYCPHCNEEITSFPSEDDIRNNDYIAHTRHDRYHSIIVNED